MSLRFHDLMTEKDASLMNALQLAYLGDSVWELMVRYRLSLQKLNVHHMHKECVNLVNAHAQHMFLQNLQIRLTETEKEIVRRGRNAHPKHACPKNQNPDEYTSATGLEALFGYLYLTGQDQRIEELFNTIQEVI